MEFLSNIFRGSAYFLKLFLLFPIILKIVEGDSEIFSFQFNEQLTRILAKISNKHEQIIFLFLGAEKSPELSRELQFISFKDFNEPQLAFSNITRMPRRSSYAPRQKVSPGSIGKFTFCNAKVVVIATTDNFKDITSKNLTSFLRVDYDIFIIVGKEGILREYFLSSFGTKLRHRLGMVHELISGKLGNSSAFLVDPKVYNNGTMQIVSNPPQFPLTFSMNGRTLKVAGNTLAPYIVFNISSKSAEGGTHYGMLTMAASNFNFTLKWDIDPVRGNGKLLPDGTGNGMLGEVLSGRADISFIARLTLGQVGVIDLTTSNYVDTLVFLTRNPETHLEWTAVIYLFTYDTWGYLFLAFIVLLPIYYLNLRQAASLSDNRFNSFRAFIIPFGILLTQSVPRIPQKAYPITFFWLLFVLNMNIAYNCNLSSVLTKLKPEAVPNSFEELADRLDYNITFNYLNNGSCDCFHFFNDSTNPMIIGIMKRFMANLEADTGRCIVKAISFKKNVCIGWESVTRIGIAQNATLYAGLSLGRVSKTVHSSLNSIGFQRHSIYTRSFDGIFGLFRDMGIVIYLKRQAEAFALEDGKSWLQKNRQNSKVYNVLRRFLDDINVSVKPFQMTHFRFPYMLLIGGSITSGLFFLMEILADVKYKTVQPFIIPYAP